MTRAEDRVQFLETAEWMRLYRVGGERTQRSVALEMGVQPSMLRDWERGRKVPSTVNFITWARVLGLLVEVVDGETGSDGPAVSGVRDAGDLYGDECGERCGAGRAGSGVGDDGVRA